MKSPLSPAALKKFHRWYIRSRREMPWRGIRDPYKIWVSEILLQQTQVETVRPYYERFITKFPTVEKLAKAPVADVLKAWEGCGYYARARNLHQAAKKVVQDGGKLPTTSTDLLQLPGIGPYTAAAIASIAFDEPIAVMDGNVKRVLARVLNESRLITGTQTLNRLEQTAESLLQSAVRRKISPSDFNQMMMELGALVCKPRSPNCEICPVASECLAFRMRKNPSDLPRKAPRKTVPHYDIGAAIIRKNGKILITLRPEKGLLGGLWEFPGGKRERGESLKDCVRREIMEELGIEIAVGAPYMKVEHAYSHFRITLHSFDCRHIAGRVQKLGVAGFKWVKPSELKQFAFPKADRVILDKLTAVS